MERKEQIFIKIRFYFISLWILFLLLFLMTIDLNLDLSFSEGRGICEWIRGFFVNNVLSFLFLCLCILAWIVACWERFRWRGNRNPPRKILRVKSYSYEYFTFMTTCVIPLVFIDVNDFRRLLVLFVLLVFIGIIFVRMDLYCGNPTLSLFGYRLYISDFGSDAADKDIVLITKDRLTEGDSVSWMSIDEKTWVVKKWK